MIMKRSRKSNRVSWASGFNLCQVRLFLSDEIPSKVGMEVQEHLHKKTSWMLHSNMTESNDLPPGFENHHHLNMKEELCHIPQTKWKCPPKFVVSPNWHVAAGEESEEVVIQKLREMRSMEAFYPRISAIPPCPAVSLGMEEDYDDRLTPVIPIVPIEEEEAPEIASSGSMPQALPQGSLASPTIEASKPMPEPAAMEKPVLRMAPPDMITPAASAALTATMKSHEIDTQLLIKIFNDPKLIETLRKDLGAITKAGTTNMVSGLKQAVNSKPDMVQPLKSANGMQPVFTSPPPQLATGPVPVSLRPKPVNHVVTPEPNMGPPLPPPPSLGNENVQKVQNQVNVVPAVKDVNYYKNLIRQHGGDNNQESVQFQHSDINVFPNIQKMEMQQKLNSREMMRPTMKQKPCAFFNSPRGCRRGASCNFKHEITLQKRSGGMMDEQSGKRMRLGGEIMIGRT